MKLVMTLLVRDAEELLRQNLEFHLRQGVDFFIITDNASVDGTGRVIQDYVRAGLAEGIWEPEDTYSQARWVTRMARRAAIQHGADWVINNDDDEFWSGDGGSLKDVLAQVPAARLAVEVQRRNHPPLASVDGPGFLQAMVYRERRSLNPMGRPLPPKVCHRGFADIEVAQGNHSASRGGAMLQAMTTGTIAISHFPLRGYAAFERKIALGGAAYTRNTEADPTDGASWRWLYEVLRRGGLRAWYDRQALAEEAIARGLADGALVKDDSVLRTLALPHEGSCSLAV
ncbi:MAG TPA: glycosyltransferase family 2 protein [Caulobacteraceae bacterium]